MPPTNDFIPFATGGGANVESQASYILDPQVPIGQQPGIAKSALNNKALRQGTYIASCLAQYLANISGNDVLDDGVMSEVLTTMGIVFGNATIPFSAKNLSVIHGSGYVWDITNSGPTYADPSNSSLGTFSTLVNNGFGSVTTAAGNVAGITFTPGSITESYLVSLGIASQSGVNSDNSFQLTDGTNIVGYTGQQGNNNPGTNIITTIPLVGIYKPGVTSPVTLKVQANQNSANGLISANSAYYPAISWTLVRVS